MKIIHILLLFLVLFVSCTSEKQKQFSLLSSDKTNITFSNTITETNDFNYFTYPYIYLGAGVSVGDINNDGLVDLFFTAGVESNKLYLNKGNFEFEDITEAAGLTGDKRWYTGTTMVDVNNDGFLDIYVSVSSVGKKESWKNELYINNKDLTFTESAKEYGIDNESQTRQSTFFDYDNDGDLDLYLANYPRTPFKYPVESYKYKINNPKLKESDILYRNNGDGTFTDVTVASGILNFGLSLSATVGDFNNDGWKDIYVSNDFDSPDFVYINKQNGTFKEISKKAVNHTSQYGMGADIADFNNDFLLDIAQVDMVPEDNRRSKANMASMNPQGFAKMINAGLHYQYMQNSLQLNRGSDSNGNPIFSEISRLSGIATTDWSWSILFADLDNDGWKDISVSNGTKRDINNRDYFLDLQSRNNLGAVKLNAEETSKIPSEKVSNYVFKNKGNLTFENVVKDWGWEQKTFSNGAVYADLDNDGDLDYVINNIDQEATIYRNNNLEKNNFLQVTLKGSEKNRNGLGAKIYITTENGQQMNELTLTRGYKSSVAPRVHFGVGKTEIISEVKVVWQSGLVSIIKDVKANQNLTVDIASAIKDKKEQKVERKLFTNVVIDSLGVDFKHRENEYNDYFLEPLLPYKTSMLGSGVAVVDVNGDGLEDFYIGGSSRQSAALYVQTIEGTFVKTNENLLLSDRGYEDTGTLFFDFDSDGDQDLYVVSGGNEKDKGEAYFQDRLYINDGKGNFTKGVGVLPTIVTSGSRVKAGDYDNDGDLDLFVGGRLVAGKYPWPTKSYILKNEKGIFKDVTNQLSPDFEKLGMITDVNWTDFDGNGTLDLVVVGEWTPILFYSNTDGTFKNVTASTDLENMTGWWSGITQGDFDNDGDQDYIVGNLGLNYKYKASAKEPFEVFADDFDQNNRKDIVLSYYNFGKLFPVRGKSCSSQQIPSLKKKFKDYNSFSVADVAEVYGKDELEKAEIHYRAKNFASCYIENLGNGKFLTKQLPNEVQFSSVNKIIAQDIDKDGLKDLILAGNLYTSEIETPRNDSSMGTYLRGDGKGNFKAISNEKCGLYLKGDIKDFTTIEIKGTTFVISVTNNDYPQLIKIQN